MTDTANLGLPCIEGSQAQKHVTHNDALRILDTLVQLAVLDRDLTTPPGSPTEGQRWIVKTGATGAWSGHVNAIAAWQDGAWQFSAPQTGWITFVVDEGTLLVWNGSTWGDFFSTVTSIQNLAMLGIGTTADATNRLSAKLNNALFAAKTVAEGGDGHLRYKLSKESAAKTLSVLFQDNYSGRAEIGLTGDDNFHFKVSPDGSTWLQGLLIDAATGAVTLGNSRTAVSDAAYTVLTTDRLIAYTALTAARAVTLPAASAYPAGTMLAVVDEAGACSGSKTITINRAGSDTVNGATSFVLNSAFAYVRLESNGSNAWTAVGATAIKAPTQTVFSTGGGSGTYTTPSGATWIKVCMVAGGGGGAGSGTSPGNGTAGGNTTFGSSFLTCNGGGGGSGTAGGVAAGAPTGGDINIGGAGGNDGMTGVAGTTLIGGPGNASPFGAAGRSRAAGNGASAGANTGSGGGGAGVAGALSCGGGGASGGYLEKITAAPASSYSYAVGAAGSGGTAGTSGFAGGGGAAGIIIVEEHYN